VQTKALAIVFGGNAHCRKSTGAEQSAGKRLEPFCISAGVVCGMNDPVGRVPAKRLSPIGGLHDIHALVRGNPELKTASGADSKRGDSPGFSIRISEGSNSANLREPSNPFQQKLAREQFDFW